MLEKTSYVLKSYSVYELYYNYDEPAKKIPSYRILALNRGEKENHLKVKMSIPKEDVLHNVQKMYRVPIFFKYFQTILSVHIFYITLKLSKLQIVPKLVVFR